MKSVTLKTKILAAAVCGVLAGGASYLKTVHADDKDDKAKEEKKDDKHGCKGMNNCKGKSGCKSGDMNCGSAKGGCCTKAKDVKSDKDVKNDKDVKSDK